MMDKYRRFHNLLFSLACVQNLMQLVHATICSSYPSGSHIVSQLYLNCSAPSFHHSLTVGARHRLSSLQQPQSSRPYLYTSKPQSCRPHILHPKRLRHPTHPRKPTTAPRKALHLTTTPPTPVHLTIAHHKPPTQQTKTHDTKWSNTPTRAETIDHMRCPSMIHIRKGQSISTSRI
jgi:hypothetical protein